MAKKTYLRIMMLFAMMMLSLSSVQAGQWKNSSVLKSGKWVKIRVSDEGMYQLSKSALSSMGFSNPDNVRLYGYNLPMLPETNIEKIDDDLVEIPLYRRSSDGALLFYSKGLITWKRKNSTTPDYTHRNNTYSKYVYYFLTENASEAPAKLQETDATASGSVNQSTYYAHSLIDNDEFSFLNGGRTFFEKYDFANGNKKTYNLSLEDVPVGDVYLGVQFGSSGTYTSTLTVRNDTTLIGTLSLSANQSYCSAFVASSTYTLRNIVSNSLKITLQHTRTSGVLGHLDYLQACYEANLKIGAKNYLAFNPNTTGTNTYAVEHSGNIAVMNVSSPAKTCTLKGADSGDSKKYTFTMNNSHVNECLVAFNPDANYPSPESVGTVANQNLHELENIDLLIIIPTNRVVEAQAIRLGKAHEEYDSMTYAVVAADQVYNEFSSGTPDATAYRRIMKMLYDKANNSTSDSVRYPRNLLLFGPGVWDNRLVTSTMSGKKADDYLLCWESYNSWSLVDCYVGEEYFCLLDDGEGVSPLKQKPDAGVGRIPATSEAEAKGVVDKIIAYMDNDEAGEWKNLICFMADDGNENVHMSDAEEVLASVESEYPNFQFKRIYWDSYKRQSSSTGSSYPEAYNEINMTMSEGALIMNYTGHGAAYCLSHEQILKTADFQNWSSPCTPLWLTAGCEICPFDMNMTNLAVEGVLNKKGSAIGMISTARTVYSSPNRTINKNFMKRVLERNANGKRNTLGEALALAKCDILGSKTYFAKLDTLNKTHYVLIGDPALSLLPPTYTVKVDSINGKALGSKTLQQMSAGQIVSVSGHIEDETGKLVPDFKGKVIPTIFDAEQTITCYNNDGSAKAPYTYKDRTRKIYTGSYSVKEGKFGFSFPMPLDILYADERGEMCLYAIDTKTYIEANGKTDQFIVGGSVLDQITDTIGPEIKVAMTKVTSGATPVIGDMTTLYITLSDESGINTTGNGIGHDIIAMIDNNESTTTNLNPYFNQTVGDFKSGSITYTITGLPTGKHTMLIRAFDIYNNVGTYEYEFEVIEGLTKRIEIFDMTGRQCDDSNLDCLPPGAYIRRTVLYSDKTGYESSTVDKIALHGTMKKK